MDKHENAQIIFHVREVTEYGNYNDSLYFSFDEWTDLKEDDLTARIKGRVDNWIAVVTNPPAPYIPTEEEFIKAKEYALTQVAEIEAKMAELYPKPIKIGLVEVE